MKWRQSKFRFLKNCILYSGIFSMTILYSTELSPPAFADPVNESSQLIESQSEQEKYPTISGAVGPLNPLNPEESVEPIDSVDRQKKAVEEKKSDPSEIELIHPKSDLEGIPDGSKAIKITDLDDLHKKKKNVHLNQVYIDENMPLPSEPFPNGKGKKTTEMAYIEEVFSELSGVVFFGVKQR
ncbi:hypothetical protein [Carnobacterium maltaromaticum]|jgi:hypothetical protein|uniref:hypothetical protein n=1 Tax=Carnobacterium maltaromaticum TaxID=2751 RepID=UPI000E740448|nr:hypothetical protein [Carnobacterium maltaromaticum]AOA02811.1 hypothetical protein BFC23_10025 [Carnobacterium maltaromaticum]MCI1819262.1 hypothetical protein [Carnobacterium maltaromaticum]